MTAATILVAQDLSGRYQIEEALARREAGEPMAEIGRSYGVIHSTMSWL
jgi:hypothetical protein